MPPPSPMLSNEDGDGRSLVAEFESCLDRQELLCRSLENLADGLPGRMNTHEALLLMGRLKLLLRQAHQLEEALVFPALTMMHRDLSPVLRRLAAEHAEDEDHAGDLEEALAAFAADERRDRGLNAEGVAYMMRCLFVGLRRHVAFDRDYIRPLLGPDGEG